MNERWTGVRTNAVLTVALLTFFSKAICAQSSPQGPPESLPGLDTRLIDTSVDPCVDFAKYACGNFERLHPIPSDRAYYGIDDTVRDYVTYRLQSMIESVASNKAVRAPDQQKVGDFYAACINVGSDRERDLAPLNRELQRISALQRRRELPALLARLSLLDVNAFFDFRVQQDQKDARRQIAAIDQGGLGLPERGYYLRSGESDEKIRLEYEAHISRELELLGSSREEASSDAGKIVNLEKNLADLSQDITFRRDPNNIYHLTPIRDLSRLTPDFAWRIYFARSGAPNVSEVDVTSPPFFAGLDRLLVETDLETIRAYLRWHLIAAMPNVSLPGELDKEAFDFYGRTLRGQLQQSPRWRRCISATVNSLGDSVGKAYVAQEFPPSSKAATLKMVHDIEASMDADIDQIDWMSPATKIRAKEKLKAVANKIGYPDTWVDYSKVEIRRDDSLGNTLRAREAENLRESRKIGHPVDRGEFIMPATVVGAYYSAGTNDINFPAGMLQPPFYDPQAPSAVNYGHIGAVIGHELTHGFDDSGRKFDGTGNLSNWWTAEDIASFNQKAACQVEEYGRFVVDGNIHVNGSLTLGENLADNGGLRLAYMAMIADSLRTGTDLKAKIEGYTPAQQFFVAFGQDWCGTTRPEQERLDVQSDPHAPARFRVNGAVQNMREFGEAFGCKQGQPMAPVDICRVW